MDAVLKEMDKQVLELYKKSAEPQCDGNTCFYVDSTGPCKVPSSCSRTRAIQCNVDTRELEQRLLQKYPHMQLECHVLTRNEPPSCYLQYKWI